METRNVARIAGISYLLVFIFSILANFFVFEKLIVSGDAFRTVTNIVANKSLFRLGITGWIVVIVFDAIVAWALYIFFKPTNKSLSLLAAMLRLVFVAIFSYSLVNYFSILQFFSGATYLDVLETKYVQAQSMLLIKTAYFAVRLSYVFFGLHIFLLGYLILKSEGAPRIIGVLLIIASCGYLIDCFGNFLSQAYENNKSMFMIVVGIPALVSELSLTVWLMFKGGRN